MTRVQFLKGKYPCLRPIPPLLRAGEGKHVSALDLQMEATWERQQGPPVHPPSKLDGSWLDPAWDTFLYNNLRKTKRLKKWKHLWKTWVCGHLYDSGILLNPKLLCPDVWTVPIAFLTGLTEDGVRVCTSTSTEPGPAHAAALPWGRRHRTLGHTQPFPVIAACPRRWRESLVNERCWSKTETDICSC